MQRLQIQIVISGPARSGKSAITQLLLGALKEHGFLAATDDDGSFRPENVFRSALLAASRATDVTINVRQVSRFAEESSL